MMTIIGMALIIAIGINTLLLQPLYWVVLKKIKLDRKPLTCSYCLGYWISLVVALFSGYIGIAPLQMLAVIMMTPYLSVFFERLFYSLSEGFTELNERVREGKK